MDNNFERENIIEIANKYRWEFGENIHDLIVESIYKKAEDITHDVVFKLDKSSKFDLDNFLDKIVTNKWTGIPIMLLLLAFVFWITIVGANYPSSFLSFILVDNIHPFLIKVAEQINIPWWLKGVLIDGGYLAMAWVVSVMLPPMAIFFPMFTFLEDFGYLPRVAFNMDSIYKKVGAHGKQALTMSMGFGCNAAGVIATRIIDSPREK